MAANNKLRSLDKNSKSRQLPARKMHTCPQCGTVHYSDAEYLTHWREVHAKVIVANTNKLLDAVVIPTPQPVDTDRKVEKPKTKRSRKGRTPAAKPNNDSLAE